MEGEEGEAKVIKVEALVEVQAWVRREGDPLSETENAFEMADLHQITETE